MKNFFKIVVLAAIFCLVASCENSIGKKTIDENDGDTNDTEVPDGDTDSGDTEVPDNPDTEIPDDPDTDTSDTTDDSDDDVVDTTDTDTPAVYNTPYGSLTISFDNMIGSEEDPSSSNEVFATGTYGNGIASIMPEYADNIETIAVVQDDKIYIQQTPIYADGAYGNPVVEFFLPVEQANVGFYNVNYDGAVSLVVAEVDWNTFDTLCYHAFGEGQIEVSEANVNELFKVINFGGNVTLYSPKNYKWADVSDAFLETFTETGVICDPVN